MIPTPLAERVLVVIYDLCDGEVGTLVNVPKLTAECNRIGIKTMTDVEFELYRMRVLADVKRRRGGKS